MQLFFQGCKSAAFYISILFYSMGVVHGFVVLSETAVFQYKCDEFYHPEADGASVSWMTALE